MLGLMKRQLIVLALLALGTLGQAQQTVLVAAAANLSALEGPLTQAFGRQSPGYQVRFTFGSSGALVTQISQGAPFEVFLSADRAFAQKLVDSGAAQGPVKTYAVGKLIVLSTKPLDWSQGLRVLAGPGVVQVATSDPVTAPYGRAAVEALTRAGLYDLIKSKIVTAQSVAQALQFTLTATGVGFVAKSALGSKEVKPLDREGTFWFEVDPSFYGPLDQGFVLTKAAAGQPGPQAFARLLLSPEAQAIFTSSGYGRP